MAKPIAVRFLPDALAWSLLAGLGAGPAYDSGPAEGWLACGAGVLSGADAGSSGAEHPAANAIESAPAERKRNLRSVAVSSF